MSAKASDFDRTELDIMISLMMMLHRNGRGARYRSELFAYAERWVTLTTAELRQQHRVFHTDPPQKHRIMGRRDSAPTRPLLLQPEDLE